MLTSSPSFLRHVLLISLLAVAAGAMVGCDETGTMTGGSMKYQPELMLSLPPMLHQPDGATLCDKTGNLYVSSPNFNDPNYPAVVFKITPENQVMVHCILPVHPKTGIAGPMGLDIGPDGNLYVADNQYFADPKGQSRLLRINMTDGRAVGVDVVVEGMNLANAVIWRGDRVYVSDTFFDIEGEYGAGGIWCFTLAELNKGPVKVAVPTKGKTDPHVLVKINAIEGRGTGNAGPDGLTFDEEGNLYTGNFGDGVMYKMTFNKDRSLKSCDVFAKLPELTCVDGIFYRAADKKIYIADSQWNSVKRISLDGKLENLWQNSDTNGAGSMIDQPCEVIVRGNELIVVDFDMPFPGLLNSTFDAPHTIHVIQLD